MMTELEKAVREAAKAHHAAQRRVDALRQAPYGSEDTAVELAVAEAESTRTHRLLAAAQRRYYEADQ